MEKYNNLKIGECLYCQTKEIGTAHRVPIDCVIIEKGYKYIINEGNLFTETETIKLKDKNKIEFVVNKVEQNLSCVSRKINETLFPFTNHKS